MVLLLACTRPNPLFSPDGDTSSGGGEGSQTGASADATTTSDDGEGTADGGSGEAEPQRCNAEDHGCFPTATCTLVDDQPQCECPVDEGLFGDGILCEPVALETQRIELPCEGAHGGHFCPMSSGMASTVLVGDPGVRYAVTLRFRGVIEYNEYHSGVDGGWYHLGGEPTMGGFNVFALRLPQPPRLYHLNAGQFGGFQCYALDEQLTLELWGGASLELTANAGDEQGLFNKGGDGAPIIVDGVPPPEGFDGQFIQVDLVEVGEAQG